MSGEAIRRIVLFGGGRWARVLLSVLRHIRPAEAEILWVTKHSRAAANSWLSQNPIDNLQLVSEVDLKSANASAVIIATSPESHFHLAPQATKLGLPTLCEKPIAPDPGCVDELLELSRKSGASLGLHLELMYASYLSDFATHLRSVDVHSVHIEWLDPWCEQRSREKKYSEVYTDIMNDQIPHCWSILAAVLETATSLKIHSVEEDAAGALVSGTYGTSAVNCRLSRRAESRVRRVVINDGELELHFSEEPGVTVHAGKTTENDWALDRPLSRSLSSFLRVANDPGQYNNWPLALANCLPAVTAALDASARLRIAEDQRILEWGQDSAFDFGNARHVQLIVDRFVPEFASKGRRFSVETAEEQKEFARVWWSERK